jgi:nanoRNase/pAp phosphatase (c-di-AMP/oligoRNAs hydrolase)
MTETTPPAGEDKNSAYIPKFRNLFADKKKRAAIFTHAYPDPDAIGSVMGVEWLLSKAFGLESDGFFTGPISHPQNVAMVNLLDPNMKAVEEYRRENYDFHVLVDTVPVNGGVGPHHDVHFDLVIDHHKECCAPDFPGMFLNLKAGSCCGTVYDMIRRMDLAFEDDVEADSIVATALLIGITTDTENLMSDDSTEYEFDAYAALFPHRNPPVLRKIVNFDRPKFWIDTKAAAILKASIEDGVGIVGMGIIPGKHRDMISDMSQDMVSWEGVDTAIAFALVDGCRIEGSVRSNNAAISVPKLSKDLGGRHGSGGGKLGKGAYKFDLGGGSIDDEDDDETREKTWQLFADKEKNRILRIIRK